MSMNDDQLMELIKNVMAGTATKQELAMEIQEEVFGLAYSVVQDEAEAKNLTKNALVFICKNLESFKEGQNVRRHIATLTSVYLYSKVSGGVNESQALEYEYNKIREDGEFLESFKEDAKAFKNPVYFKKASARFKSLEPIQMVLLQLYAYEMNSIDTIEEMLQVDSAFIGSIIAQTRAALLGIKLEKADGLEGDGSGVDVFEDIHEQGDNFFTTFLAGIFPSLTLKMRKIITYCAGSVLIATIAAVVVVALVMSRKTTDKAPSEQADKETIKETVTAIQGNGSNAETKAPIVPPGQTVPLDKAPTVPQRTQATKPPETSTPQETSTPEVTSTEKETSSSETVTDNTNSSEENNSSEDNIKQSSSQVESNSVTNSSEKESSSTKETTSTKAPLARP